MKTKCLYILTISILSSVLVGCQSPIRESGQIKTELYFGMSNSAGEIPESQWIAFKREVVENIFNGFTEVKGEGYWISDSGTKYYEKSVILLYIHENNETENQKIDSLISLFKKRFDQESVLQTDQELDVYFK